MADFFSAITATGSRKQRLKLSKAAKTFTVYKAILHFSSSIRVMMTSLMTLLLGLAAEKTCLGSGQKTAIVAKFQSQNKIFDFLENNLCSATFKVY